MSQASLAEANAMFFSSLRSMPAKEAAKQVEALEPEAGLVVDAKLALDTDLTIDTETSQEAGSTEEPELSQGADTEDDDREALAAAFKDKFGKAPHHRTATETIRKKLAEPVQDADQE